MILPTISARSDYVAVYANNDVWLPAIRAICRRHGLPQAELRRQVLGTHVVFRTSDLIVKLFCPFWPGDFAAEREALLGLRDLPVPELVQTGELESWPYLILTVLPGQPAKEVWPTLEPAEKIRLIHEIGRLMRTLHGLPTIPGLRGDWDRFLSDRVAELDEHHHLTEPWREWVHEQVAEVVRRPQELVTLDCDLGDDHILLLEQSAGWRVSGIIDFGDSMTGHYLYDFAAPLLCFAHGEPSLARALVESYGRPMTPELAEGILAYCFLHKYITLSDIVAQTGAQSAESLFEAVWGMRLL